MSDERDYERHAPESISSDDSVPRPQDALSEGEKSAVRAGSGLRKGQSPPENARCAHCKTMTRPGFLCRMCSRFVPFPPRSSQNATGIPYRPTY